VTASAEAGFRALPAFDRVIHRRLRVSPTTVHDAGVKVSLKTAIATLERAHADLLVAIERLTEALSRRREGSSRFLVNRGEA
jgi:hypothetical protein